MRPSLRRCCALLAGIVLTAAAFPTRAQPTPPPQASAVELRAAYLYRFLPFVEWPPARFASPQAPIVIALAGAPEIAAELQRLVEQRAAQGRPIAVRVLAASRRSTRAR